MKIQGKEGSVLIINEEWVIVKEGYSTPEIRLKKDDIEEVKVIKGNYDRSFMEKSVIIKARGQAYEVRRLLARDAEQAELLLKE